MASTSTFTPSPAAPPAFGLFIPPHIKTCPDLGWSERALLAQIHQLSRSEAGCYASHPRLASELGLAVRTVDRLMGELQDRGLIQRQGRHVFLPPDVNPVWRQTPEKSGASGDDSDTDNLSETPTFCRDNTDNLAGAPPTFCRTDTDILTVEAPTFCRRNTDILSGVQTPEAPPNTDILSAEAPTFCRENTDILAGRSELEVKEEENKNLKITPNPPCAASRAEGDGEKHSHSQPPPATPSVLLRELDPLEKKLVEVCGLEALVGLAAFPRKSFVKCVTTLRELGARPEELDRFVAWWRGESLSYRRTRPRLRDVSAYFHESRPERRDSWTKVSPELELPADAPATDEEEDHKSEAVLDALFEGLDEDLQSYRRPMDPRFRYLLVRGAIRQAREAGDEELTRRLIRIFRHYYPDSTAELEGDEQ